MRASKEPQWNVPLQIPPGTEKQVSGITQERLVRYQHYYHYYYHYYHYYYFYFIIIITIILIIIS